jgi:signal transduction histidine kinase
MTRGRALAALAISGVAGFLAGRRTSAAPMRAGAPGPLASDGRRIAEEQAALRRVATLVARGTAPEDVFAAVTEEAGRVLRTDHTNMIRYGHNGTGTVVGAWTRSGAPGPVAVGDRVPLGGSNLATVVLRTGRSARIDDYTGASGPAADIARAWGSRAAVGVPITVDGRVWGVMSAVSTSGHPRPPDDEAHLAGFTELVATAIADAQARVELRGFAEEQAALRRVAVLVARPARPEEVFAAVSEEVGRLLDADLTALGRFELDGDVTGVGVWSASGDRRETGVRTTVGGRNVTTLVHETGRPARIDDYGDTSGPVADVVRGWGLHSSVGVPISVDGRLWGVIVVSSAREQPLPSDTEVRLTAFTELVATAIANAESQAQLTASRARIVAAADDARRRIERDLHDGAQQRLVTMALQLKAAQEAVPPGTPELAARLDELVAEATSALEELRELARGIHPAVLVESGLPPALTALARRCPVPVELDVRIHRRLPEPVEVAAYYLVAEALTNAAKHANASAVQVEVGIGETGDVLRVRVRDDGRGGVRLSDGSGLLGLGDRVEALGGRLWVQSASDAGTTVQAELPLRPAAAVPG